MSAATVIIALSVAAVVLTGLMFAVVYIAGDESEEGRRGA